MSKGMLGDNTVLRRIWDGPLAELMVRLNGAEGEKWLAALNRFNRHENPWPDPAPPPHPKRRRYIVDLDADPFVPNGWKVDQHRQLGKVRVSRRGDELCVNGKSVELWLSESQSNGQSISGRYLQAELADKPVLNANLLDWLLRPENQHFIPESWKGQFVFFWGTVYGAGGARYVRSLCWDDGRWYWGYGWLGYCWDDRFPAALAAS